MTQEFWLSSGYRLLETGPAGGLAVTDDFLRAYLARPEIAPIAESCPEERELHASLLAEPRMPVSEVRLDRLDDPDARENYGVFLRFRDRLLSQATLEAAYRAFFREGTQGIPPLFLDQIVHAILRSVLDGCGDPVRLRAAELLFRTQRVTIIEGNIIAADEEIVDARARDGGFGALGRLVSETGTQLRNVQLDVLSEDNGELYWERSDRFDTALEIGFGRPGLDAFCRVLEAWVRHMAGVEVGIQPVQRISDEHWSWHIGLDAEASGLLDDLWNGQDPGEERMARLLSLFRLDFADPSVMLPRVAGRPVYLAMAMTADGRLRVKPQNLLMNLPLAGLA